MLTRQQIIKTIRNIHRCGEPLNITAVKRHHPELMKAVYAVRPYWGWKQALNDAGIDYARIKVELQEYITCELCGKPMINLANHLILKHKVKPDDYLTDYPDSELQSETLRAEKTIGKSRFLRQWEPCWSREYILDRVDEYHRRGYPMHYGKFSDMDTSLMLATKRYLGGWREALIAVGLDPRKVTQEAYRQLHKYPDKESVIQGIKERLKRGLRLNRGSVHASKASLLTSGIEYFGSWDNALKAAWVDSEAIHQALKPKRKYETKQDIIREIRARHKRKWAINHGELYHGKHQDGQLGVYAGKYFGSWNNALKAAGFDPIKIQKHTSLQHLRYPDKQSVLKAMKRRNEKGRFMNYGGLAYGSDRDNPLLERASKFFGSWDSALKAAGLDPIEIHRQAILRRCRYPDKESVVKVMKQRVKEGRFINHRGLAFGHDQDLPLLNRALEFFGSWDSALKAAGLDPVKVRRQAILNRCRYPDAKSVLKGMRQRNKEGRRMNYGSLDSGADRDRTLLNWAVKFFGSWNNALRKIGLNPAKSKQDAKFRAVRRRCRKKK